MFASALSEHPVTAHAVGEVAGQVLEAVGTGPDLALVFVTRPHGGALEDVSNAIRSILQPATLAGCVSASAIGVGREVEEAPAVALWAGRVGPVRAAELSHDGERSRGWPAHLEMEPAAAVLLADPYSFPAEVFFAQLAAEMPGLPVIGGNAAAALGAGGNRLVLDASVRSEGAVAVLIDRVTGLHTVVSQGCRPIGRPFAVTRSDGNVLHELAGQPALDRLMQVARQSLSEKEVATVNSGGLHLGIVIDEHRADFGRGDFLVRNVLGGDRSNGAIAVGAHVELGQTVQFHLRDATTADEDLGELLCGRQADAALMFSCNGRGKRLFGRAHHDARAVEAALGPVPLGGMFAAGEFGPVGGKNFVHGLTASVALFDSPGFGSPGSDSPGSGSPGLNAG